MTDHPTEQNTGRARREGRASKQDRDGATFMALAIVLLMGFALLALMAIVIPGLSGVLGVIAFLMFTIAFHYVVWGRWMSRQPLADEDEADV
jgi:hypothetical protein